MDKVSKDIKLNAAKDIVIAYLKSATEDKETKISVEETCEALKKVYSTIEDMLPDKSDRKIGLG